MEDGRRVLMHNFSYDNEFDLHATEKLNEWFPSRCKTRFETEAKYKCEMALYRHKPEREKNLSAARQIKNKDVMFLPNTEVVTELYPHTIDKIICAWRKLR